MQPKWLEWAQQIQAIAQKGLLFNKNPYQIEDYKSLRSIGAEIIATHTKIETSEVLDLLIKDIGYPTPKVGVSSAVFQDNKILLVKNTCFSARSRNMSRLFVSMKIKTHGNEK